MQLSKLEAKIFQAVIEHFNRSDKGGVLLEKDIGMLFLSDVPTAVVRSYLAKLEDHGLLVRKQDSRTTSRSDWLNVGLARDKQLETVQGPPCWELTLAGSDLVIEQAGQEILQDKTENTDASIPASDRFVNSSDNGEAVAEAQATLAKLREMVQSSNELSIAGEDRVAVVRELSGVELLLSGIKIRAAALWQATRDHAALGWLKREGGSGTVRALATAVVNWLLKIIGLG